MGTVKSARPFFVGGRAQTAPGTLAVTEKHMGQEMAHVCIPGLEAVDRAINAAASAFGAMSRLPAHKRHDSLVLIARRLRQRAEELAKVIAGEVGKPIGDAKSEVSRAIDTFSTAAQESVRMYGEYIPLDTTPRGENTEAFTRRVPIGPATFITPFNFPLNLAAHKVAPAIAVGCPFILKPDPRTPLSSLILGEILVEAELPPGSFSILPVTDEAARDKLVTDDRIRLVSFTGSTANGWKVKAAASKKKVLLELGGVGCCIIDAPISKADLDRVTDRVVHGAFFQAGQSCISVQRVFIHRSVYVSACEFLIAKAKKLKVGDPMDEATTVGPMISLDQAERVEQWIEEAVGAGAKVLTGGQRVGSFIDPTFIEKAPDDCRILREEVFGPVAVLEPFDSFDEALDTINALPYGLQAGLFTASLSHAFRAWNTLEVGGLIVNDVPSMRPDAMPYGGTKESGMGREGVRFAMQEMTELRTMVLRNVGRVRSSSGGSKGPGQA